MEAYKKPRQNKENANAGWTQPDKLSSELRRHDYWKNDAFVAHQHHCNCDRSKAIKTRDSSGGVRFNPARE